MKQFTTPSETRFSAPTQWLRSSLLLLVSLVFSVAIFAQATVTTDKPDYAPRSNAVFTGAGFQPYEQVQLKVKNLFRACNTVTSDSSYLPWTVTADANGGFVTDWTVCDCAGDSLRLKATGLSSGLIAYALFSDANTSLSNPSPNSAVFGSVVSFSSTLTQSGSSGGCITCVGNNNPIPGKAVVFSVAGGTSLGSGMTDASGIATSTVTVTLPVGSYNGTSNGLKAIFAGDPSNNPYSGSNNTVNFSVTQATTVFSAISGSGSYGSSVNLTATVNLNVAGLTINFSLNGTSVGNGTTNSSGVATLIVPFASIPVAVRNAGTYTTAVNVNIAGTTNYTSASATGSLNISKLTASVTPNAASKTYGDADPSFTGTLTGFLGTDGVTATYSRTVGETVAGSPYTISAVLSPVGVLGNYDITYNTADFTISKKAASVTPNAASKTYGDADPSFTGTLTGFLGADGVTATYSRTVGETVAGSPYTISAVLSPVGVLGNYDITYNTADFTISKKAASVTPNAASKTYGDADPSFTGTLTGFLGADGVTATYSRTVGETVAGSPYTISAVLSPVGVLGNYDITYNTADFTISKKAASVTPNAASKTYGDADPSFTGTLTGFLGADGVTATYSRTVGETVAGSPYTISAVLSPVGVLGNYDITYNTADFTISKKAASVTPNAASKTYGDADPSFTGTLTGFLGADGVTATYSRTVGETVAGSPYTISAVLSPVGVLGNYDITYNTADFTISKKAASVTPNAASKTYGDADPSFTGTLTGFLGADGVTATYSRTVGETVAGSPYTISAVLSPVGVLGNYDITYNTADFTISKKAASVTPNAASKTYGDADPSFTGTLTGFLGTDGVTATYSRTVGETVAGSPYTISAVLSPVGVLGNYDITYNTADFTISKKAASVTPNAASKTYGDADPSFTGTLTGFLGTDGVTATYSRTVGETVAGSPYTISAVLSPVGVLGNYDITYNTADFTISKKAASVTPNAASKTYGDADPSFTGTLTGFLGADGVTATYSRTVGETVAGSPYTISAVLSPVGVLGNYDITYNTADFTISKKAASVTPNAASKTYGDADPSFTGTLTGFLGTDGVTATYSRTVGETVAGSPYTISAVLSPVGVLGNYDITYNTADFTISKKAASVTPNAASKTYGDADPSFTGTLTGFLGADGVTATYSRTVGETVAGSPYTISAVLSPVGVLGNYDITYNTADFTISKKAASVTPNAASKTYGDADPSFTGTLTGFLGADGVTATYSRTVGETVAGSPYTISAVLSPVGVLGNYDITYNTADFTISKKAASVTPNAASKTYGDADPSFTGTLTGFLGTDGVTATYSRTVGETVAGSPYTISAVLSPVGVLGNYDITYNTADFTISKKAASVTPNAASKTYGDADPSFTGTLTGFLGADGVTATYSRTVGETVAGSPYTISAVLSPVGVLGNYDITYNTADFTISKKAASVTPNAASKTYGDADPSFTGTLTGFLGADGVTATYSRTVGETVAGSPYTISAVLSPVGVLGNYDITYNTADFTISKKAASVTPNAASKTYGDADPSFTGTLTGFLGTDGVTATYSRTVGETVAGSPYTISAVLSPVGVLGNYDITYNTADFTISKKAASVTPNAASKTYGDADPSFTGTLTGFLGTDGVTATYSRTVGETVAGSPYTISAVLSPVGVLGNYDITYNTADFTISKKAASVTPNAASKTYGDADPSFTGTLTGFLGTDGVTATYSRTVGETVAGSPYTISAVLSPVGVLGNYDITYNTADFTISKKAASVTPNAASKFCGQNDPALGGVLTGFLSADNVAATYSRNAGEVAGGAYTISATLTPVGVLSNYAITYNTASFTINGVTIDASTSSTPVQKGNSANLSATISPAENGVSVVFVVTDESNTVIYTSPSVPTINGVATATTSAISVVGVYKVVAQAGTTCASSTVFFPVFDPTESFVTGGGWINSPIYTAADYMQVEGKANFGFVSKYKKGSSQVDGNTEFQFQAGNLNFKSTMHESGSLVISGGKATYRGTGTVNNLSGYKFVVVAIDGDWNNGTDADRFRIKITRTSDNKVVYDNQYGKEENTAEATMLGNNGTGGGSIVIHEVKATGKKAAIVDYAKAETLEVKTANNPSLTGQAFVLQFKSDDTKAPITLKVVDVNGKAVEMKQQILPGSTVEIGRSYTSGLYIAEAIQNNKRVVIKLMKQ